MCTTTVITGAICFLAGFGIGRFLNLSKKATNKTTKEYLDYIVTIKYNG